MKPPRCQHCEERADRIVYFGRGRVRGFDAVGPPLGDAVHTFFYLCRAHFEAYETLEALKQ